MDLAAAAAASPGLVFVDSSSSRLDGLASMAAAFAPELEVLALPPWDSLPYDRTPPSPAVIGARVHALARLAEAPDQPRLVLTSARALLQRVPRPSYWAAAVLPLRLGDALDETEFRNRLASFGFRFDEHVDRPGEVAMRGQVIDLYPGHAAQPVRIELSNGRIEGLHSFDPANQRSTSDLAELILRPVMEAQPAPEHIAAEIDRIAHPDDASDEPAPPVADIAALQASLLDYIGGMLVALHPAAAEHWQDVEQEVAQSYDTARVAARVVAQGVTVPKPEQLYLATAELQQRLAKHAVHTLADAPAAEIPPARDLAALVKQIEAAREERVVVAAGAGCEAVMAALARRRVRAVECLAMTAPVGFHRDGIRLLAAPASLADWRRHATPGLPLDEPPRLSDIVVHREHGVCRLTGLRSVGDEERLALAFHEGTELLVPMADLAQLWRYGSEAGHVALDRLHGDAWRRRRNEIEAQVAETAKALAAAAAKRANTKAPVIKPPAAAFNRVVDRFAYAPSPDQQAAIDAALSDLQAGRPMDRLVCGDVGFGKTEVAVRAAAAVAMGGYQVAVVAPTTVLARQHLDTFRKRFAGTGIRVEPLLAGTKGASAQAVRDGLADGGVGIVVGTQAVAAKGVQFARLGLVVIDEEQRFGDADKRKLAELRTRDAAMHVMVMTATPIPRTLQAAMVGLRDISVIATPPVRRQPTRTFVLPLDPALVREALLREHATGGQSFVVAPRIEDLGALAAKLAEWVPELSVATAHGKLKPDALASLVGGFANGEHDVLLATNIIEAGLDIPRANTILVTGPHRFGLSQLHQMRGRVGRGARRGSAYLLTDPGAKLAAPTVRRLQTLETLEGLGAGVQIAMADMDTRGAGDLFGEAQAGHVHAIGTELYQHILARELAKIEGREAEPPLPELHAEIAGRIPDDYVPEANVRLELYRRLARLPDLAAADDLVDEMTDRFGDIPPPLSNLVTLARLRLWCQGHGVRRLDAGPQAVGLTLADPAQAKRLAATLPDATVKEARILLGIALHDANERISRLMSVLFAPDLARAA